MLRNQPNIGAIPRTSASYALAMERLVRVVQWLSRAPTLEAITQIVTEAARDLSGADGASFVLRDDDKCYYVEENSIAPLWKGQRFPMKICVSGWVMLHGEAVFIPDIYRDTRVPQDTYRPTFVKSLMMVPIRHNNPIGAIGTYWATHHEVSLEEQRILQTLADVTSLALENVRLHKEVESLIAKP